MPTWLVGQQAALSQCSRQDWAQCTKGPGLRMPVDAKGLRPPDTSSPEARTLQPESLQGLWADF